MGKKIDLTQNFKGKRNIKNFSNDKVDFEKIVKKNIVILANKEIVDEFKVIAFEFYKKNKILSLFSWAHFFSIAIKNIELYYKKKYKDILVPDTDYLAFYQRKSKASNANEFYNLEDLERLTLVVKSPYIELFYSLMHTFYVNERSKLTSFSVSIYFYDFVTDLKNINKIEYYNK